MPNTEIKDKWCILKLKPLQMFFHACPVEDVQRVRKNIQRQADYYREVKGVLDCYIFTSAVMDNEPTGVLYGLRKGRAA